MERKLVTIQKIKEVKPIEGADNIELVFIQGWQCVSKKGEFKKGDLCIYFEIDSLLPLDNPVWSFLEKGNKPKKVTIGGTEYEGYRLKTIKLRGQLSQGLALPTSILEPMVALEEGKEVTGLLGVVKYEAPIPAQLSGKVKGTFPTFIPKTDEERIQNMPEVLSGFYVAEKLDGTSVTYYKRDGILGVCSRNLELLEGDTTQWGLAKEMDLSNKIPDGFAIQGEIIGEGIQKNIYKIKGHRVYFFNVYNISSNIYLNYQDFINFIRTSELETVPIFTDTFSLPTDINELLTYAEGKSALNPETEREGIVIRPKTEQTFKGERLSFKVISNKYLMSEK